MKKIVIIGMVLVAMGMVACAGGGSGVPKTTDEYVARIEDVANRMAEAFKSGDTAKIEAIQKEAEGLDLSKTSFKQTDFSVEQQARIAAAGMKMLGGLGDVMKGLGDALGTGLGEALGGAATDAAAPATTTP